MLSPINHFSAYPFLNMLILRSRDPLRFDLRHPLRYALRYDPRGFTDSNIGTYPPAPITPGAFLWGLGHFGFTM